MKLTVECTVTIHTAVNVKIEDLVEIEEEYNNDLQEWIDTERPNELFEGTADVTVKPTKVILDKGDAR